MRLWAVVNDDGTYAGVPCITIDEAMELARQHEGSFILEMTVAPVQAWNGDITKVFD